jgi:hypothetical protein
MGTERAQPTSTDETRTVPKSNRLAHIISEYVFPLWSLALLLLCCLLVLDFLTGTDIIQLFPRSLAVCVGLYVAFAGISDENMHEQDENTHHLRSLPLLRADGNRRQVGGLIYSVGAVLLILMLLGGTSGSGGGAPSATPTTDTPATTTAVGTYDNGYDDNGEEEDDDVHVRPGSGGSDDSSGGSDSGDYNDDGDYGGDYGDGDAGPDVDVGGGGVNIDWI